MKFETAYCLMINLYDYERRWNMMPLTFMNIGETKTITKVGGKNETRQCLACRIPCGALSMERPKKVKGQT